MVHLDADSFLQELTKLYEQAKKDGSVCVAMKRHTPKRPPAKAKAAASWSAEDERPRLLVRATLKKRKIATFVVSERVREFRTTLMALQKLYAMDSLKKRVKRKSKDRKKRKKASRPTA